MTTRFFIPALTAVSRPTGRLLSLGLFMIFPLFSQAVLAQDAKNNWDEAMKIKGIGEQYMKIGKKSTVTVALVLMALLAKPQITFAQVTPTPLRGSWEGLKAVPSGDKVEVDLRNGQSLKGRLISVSDTVLTIERGKRTTDVTRADTLRVHRVITKSAKKATLIGLGIGAGIAGIGGGAATAAVGAAQPRDYAIVVGFLAAIGAGVGALIGYIVGSRKHRALIYETR